MGDMYVTVNDNLGIKVPSADAPSIRISAPLPLASDDPLRLMRLAKSTYTLDEIVHATDHFLRTGKVSLSDPIFVSEIIEELTSRRIELMLAREYRDAQFIVGKISKLKSQLLGTTWDALLQQHLAHLEERRRETQLAMRECRTRWRAKYQDDDQVFSDHVCLIKERQDAKREAMVMEWTGPEMQRRFNKQSKELLETRHLEQMKAVMGDLADADEFKKLGQRMERREVAAQSKRMSQAFEQARDRLEGDLADQMSVVRERQTRRKMVMAVREQYEMDNLKKKIELLDSMMREEQIQARRRTVVKSSAGSKLPMLARTVENVRALTQMRRQTIDRRSDPLPLPPLDVRKHRAAKPPDAPAPPG
jgi:hypothetical protein